MTQRVFVNNSDQTSNGLLSISSDDGIQPLPGATGAFYSTASSMQAYALTAIVALKR
jgi:hypothetical protein